MELFIPDNINYEKIWSFIDKHKPEITTRQKEKLKESTYLFLHFLYPSPNYLQYTKRSDYFKKILSKEFNEITRNLLSVVIKILTDDDYPVIDERSYSAGNYPKSYKLKNHFFIYCKQHKVQLSKILSDNYKRKIEENCPKKHGTLNLEVGTEDLEKILYPHYDKQIITIDSNVHHYVNNIETELYKKLNKRKNRKNYNDLQRKIDNKIVSMRRNVFQIESGEFNMSVHGSNNRLYSVLTSCKKEIRKFIRINNNNISEIDISNSHLYLLNLILDKEFLSNSKKLKFKNIDPILYNKLNNNIEEVDNNNLIPYMCGTFLEKSDVDKFRLLPFHHNIYDYLNELLFKNLKSREYIKGNVMRYLNLKKYRDNNLFIRKMKEFFPSVDGVIEMINSVDENCGCLSILMQRFESYILLDIGAKQLLKDIPQLNFFTVHDSIVVEESYAQEVKDILSRRILNATGKRIGLQIKLSENPFEKIEETINSIWSKSYKKVVLERRKKKFKFKLDNNFQLAKI
ncbi:hypothetical protein [Chryseobacterium sp.]|uniref:hypothetical protein n=1 Tax=Chryseobacterium sp. TaxID=1871047 RepID=UPI00289A9895|nr:hypothetical protein [Chryseobacterium sp.]